MNQHCYFHKAQPIEHFCCLKQCTLPLCRQCLQIHQQQHADRHSQPSIIPYCQAYQQVLSTLTQFIQSAKSTKQSLLDKINRDKTQTIKTINQYYSQCQQQVQNQMFSLPDIQLKLNKLQKGSIKTVIYFYSGDINLKLSASQDFKTISMDVQKLIQNIQNTHQQHYSQQLNTYQQRQPQLYKNAPSQTRQKTKSHKKLIFSNDKHQHSLHKNTNYPYLDNPKKQQNPSFKRQYIESQVKNYFNHQNFNKQNSVAPQQYENNYRFFNQDNQKNKPLKETPIISNNDCRGTRTSIMDKYPSLVDLKEGPKENVYQPLVRNEVQRRSQNINQDYKPGKWKKDRIKGEISYNNNNEAPNSIYSQFKVTEPVGQNSSKQLFLDEQFPNRQPLKAADLDVYQATNANPVTQGRQRAFSYDPGLRTTMSHNNLQGVKKMQPILGDEMKKQVLSPQQIRRMLQKKIEERNKVLGQKKQHQLRINTDRSVLVKNNTTTVTVDLVKADNMMGQKNEYLQKERETVIISPLGKEKSVQPILTRQLPKEQRSGLYNTKDSIINQIYRQSKY